MTDQCCAICGYFFNETASCKCHLRTPMTDIGRKPSPHNAGQTVTVEQISKMPVSDVNWGDVEITENWGRLFITWDGDTIIVHQPFYPAFIKAIQHFIEPASATVSRADIEALADKIWRVHSKDLDAAGYIHKRHGGKYDNPRAAWYADQIEALLKKDQS